MVLQAIQQSRQTNTVPQRAEGNYSQMSAPTVAPIGDSLMREMVGLLTYLKVHGVKAFINYFEFESAKNKIDTTKHKARRK